ncbi:class III extradiol dioxygenase subunit B-like domain-containing protein [Actinomadura fibrosa]|uniref:Class III extradiol dioxygenase subunit B-like domain-containing protein n=1 Tax=Actinomadura fibrosa TaxID=111802 RepID=A0ABW2XJ96_9ACTN|nr:class III extradiol dioxygenase subunit B-like domain-containing protein [Actinomadura fibrosa]
MLISAAVCPHPPVLVPAMAGEAAPELDGLRAACDEAVRGLGVAYADAGVRPPRLRASTVDVLFVVGGAQETRAYGQDAYATLRPYGLDWTSPVGDGAEATEALPLSLSIGHWLLRRQEAGAGARYQSVAFDAEPEECLRLGRHLAESAERVALLVMGDGSACRSEKAPGYLDERAEPHDAAVARALEKADIDALAALDPGLAHDLLAAGRAAWQVLAGAAGARGGSGRTGGFTGRLLADEAPYGVGYLVAAWRKEQRTGA